MPAFTFSTTLADFSLSYDGFTVYPKTSEARTELIPVLTQCHKIFLAEIEVDADPKDYSISLEDIRRGDFNFQRYIHIDDDDHDLYHKDSFNRNLNHSHTKFKSALTRPRITQILDIFAEHHYITSAEKINFLLSYDNRFAVIEKKLNGLLVNNKKLDTATIKKFIDDCEDNDVLTYLHEYLATSRFNYLRVITPKPSSAKLVIWLGANERGEAVETSKAWAMIEECITVKMTENVRKNCSHFTASVAIECANEFQQDWKWFAMNHKKSAAATQNNCFTAFSRNDIATLVSEYNSHFKPKTLSDAKSSLANPKKDCKATLFSAASGNPQSSAATSTTIQNQTIPHPIPGKKGTCVIL